MKTKETTVYEVQEKLKNLMFQTVSETDLKKVHKRMQKLKNNQEFNLLRINFKNETDALIHKLISLQNEPFHKSQTVVRHSNDNLKLLLVDRFSHIIKILEKENPDTIIDVPIDFEDFYIQFLIDPWDKLLEQTL